MLKAKIKTPINSASTIVNLKDNNKQLFRKTSILSISLKNL